MAEPLAYLRSAEVIYELEDPETQIGRGDDNDIVLRSSKSVSTVHAKIVVHERGGRHRAFLQDLHSLNGTYVNDDRVLGAAVELRSGNLIRFGYDNTSYRFEFPGDTAHGASAGDSAGMAAEGGGRRGGADAAARAAGIPTGGMAAPVSVGGGAPVGGNELPSRGRKGRASDVDTAGAAGMPTSPPRRARGRPRTAGRPATAEMSSFGGDLPPQRNAAYPPHLRESQDRPRSFKEEAGFKRRGAGGYLRRDKGFVPDDDEYGPEPQDDDDDDRSRSRSRARGARGRGRGRGRGRSGSPGRRDGAVAASRGRRPTRSVSPGGSSKARRGRASSAPGGRRRPQSALPPRAERRNMARVPSSPTSENVSLYYPSATGSQSTARGGVGVGLPSAGQQRARVTMKTLGPGGVVESRRRTYSTGDDERTGRGGDDSDVEGAVRDSSVGGAGESTVPPLTKPADPAASDAKESDVVGGQPSGLTDAIPNPVVGVEGEGDWGMVALAMEEEFGGGDEEVPPDDDERGTPRAAAATESKLPAPVVAHPEREHAANAGAPQVRHGAAESKSRESAARGAAAPIVSAGPPPSAAPASMSAPPGSHTGTATLSGGGSGSGSMQFASAGGSGGMEFSGGGGGGSFGGAPPGREPVSNAPPPAGGAAVHPGAPPGFSTGDLAGISAGPPPGVSAGPPPGAGDAVAQAPPGVAVATGAGTSPSAAGTSALPADALAEGINPITGQPEGVVRRHSAARDSGDGPEVLVDRNPSEAKLKEVTPAPPPDSDDEEDAKEDPELARLRTKVEKLKAKLEAANDELHTTKSELAGVRDQLDGANEELEATKAELGGTKRDVQDTRQVAGALALATWMRGRARRQKLWGWRKWVGFTLEEQVRGAETREAATVEALATNTTKLDLLMKNDWARELVRQQEEIARLRAQLHDIDEQLHRERLDYAAGAMTATGGGRRGSSRTGGAGASSVGESPQAPPFPTALHPAASEHTRRLVEKAVAEAVDVAGKEWEDERRMLHSMISERDRQVLRIARATGQVSSKGDARKRQAAQLLVQELQRCQDRERKANMRVARLMQELEKVAAAGSGSSLLVGASKDIMAGFKAAAEGKERELKPDDGADGDHEDEGGQARHHRRRRDSRESRRTGSRHGSNSRRSDRGSRASRASSPAGVR